MAASSKGMLWPERLRVKGNDMQSKCKLISPSTVVIRILSLFALLSITGMPAIGQDCTLKNLGALPGGTPSSSVGIAINDRGSVVGFSTAAILYGIPCVSLREA